jgi:hypothetical protein
MFVEVIFNVELRGNISLLADKASGNSFHLVVAAGWRKVLARKQDTLERLGGL